MKIAIDTNILVRIIALDDPPRVEKAMKLIEEFGPRDIFVCHGVLIETYYVLTKRYEFSKEKVLNLFEDILKIEQFSFEYEIPIRLAIKKCLKGFSFNDALFGEIGDARNLKTYTFDKDLKNNKSYIVI